MKKKILALLLCAVLVLSILPMAGGAADTYLDATGTAQDIPAGAVTIDAASALTTWDTGWYVASGTVSLTNVAVSGNVNLILLDGCDLTATGSSNNPGIKVAGTNSLTIYAQSTGDSMGKLSATGGTGGAGIGCYDGTGGTVTINGGSVNAIGGIAGPGIGSGMRGAGGNITINGGTVNAIGNRGAAGIGCTGDGGGSSSVTITITGGTVTAVGSDWEIMDDAEENTYYLGGAGIGAGCQHSSGTITISGGTVNATGGYGAAGIGGGSGHLTEMAYMGDLWTGESPYAPGKSGGTITISGGSITATGQNGAASIGGGADAEEQGTITLGVTMYDENGKALTVDDLKNASSLTMTDVPPVTGPSVSVTTDVTDGTVKYPGETFTVTVAAEGVANYAGFLKLTYNTADVALTDSTFIDGAETNAATAGSVTMLIMGITEAAPTLAELTFTVQEITADKTTDVVVAQADFTPIDNMDADAIAATLDPEGGKVSVSLCAGYPVSFVASYGAASAISAQTIAPNGNATVPDSTDDVTVPKGKVFMGWADVTDGDNDTVVLAKDATTVAVTGAVTYKAVFELDITITQDINYIGGYVRIVVKDNQSAFKGFDFTFGGAANTMYKLDTDTYAYMYKPERDGNNKLAPIDLGQDTDTAAQKAAKLTAAKALFAALTAAPDSKYDLSNPTDANDVNGTGVFDIADVRATFNCANASTVTGVAFDSYVATCLRADLNKDGVVNAVDQTAIVNTALGIKTETPSMEG